MLTDNKKLIPSEVPDHWTFWDYEGAIENWYQNDLSEEAQDQFDALLKNCAKIENHQQWPGFGKFLKGVKEPIWELEFRADKRAYRVLCVFASIVAPGCWPRATESTRKRAILLAGCYHKQGVYTPANAINTAETRARALREDKAKVYERPINQTL